MIITKKRGIYQISHTQYPAANYANIFPVYTILLDYIMSVFLRLRHVNRYSEGKDHQLGVSEQSLLQ